MGLLSSIAGIALPAIGNFIAPGIGGAIGGVAAGLLGGKDQPNNLTSTSQQKLDPRADNMLWGSDGKSGLLNQYQGYLNQPQSAALQNYGNTANEYLNNYGARDLGGIRDTATSLMGNDAAPLAANASTSLPAYANGNHVNAPGQNNIDLTGSYQNLLNGGDTSKLMNSLQAGNALAGQQFKQNQSDLTDNLQRNILPGIRGNSVLAGQYGGSRQGVAEGLAISDLTKQLNNSNTQFGLGATAANSQALAGAYENGQNRALSATQGLGAQQYNVAGQNTANDMTAQLTNVNNLFDATKTNAGFAQQANLANQASQLQTNGQNNSAALAGAGLLSGVTNQAYGAAQNADNAQINRATQVNGLLSPYLAQGQSNTTSQPLYQNQAGNALGGALLGSQLSGLFGGSGAGGSTAVAPSLANYTPPTSMSIPSLPNLWG